MNEARVFEDNYSGVFREQEDFFSCLHEILGNSFWKRQKVRDLRLVPITAGSKLEKELRSQYANDGMISILRFQRFFLCWNVKELQEVVLQRWKSR